MAYNSLRFAIEGTRFHFYRAKTGEVGLKITSAAGTADATLHKKLVRKLVMLLAPAEAVEDDALADIRRQIDELATRFGLGDEPKIG